jgi:hypothetical protein
MNDKKWKRKKRKRRRRIYPVLSASSSICREWGNSKPKLINCSKSERRKMKKGERTR